MNFINAMVKEIETFKMNERIKSENEKINEEYKSLYNSLYSKKEELFIETFIEKMESEGLKCEKERDDIIFLYDKNPLVKIRKGYFHQRKIDIALSINNNGQTCLYKDRYSSNSGIEVNFDISYHSKNIKEEIFTIDYDTSTKGKIEEAIKKLRTFDFNSEIEICLKDSNIKSAYDYNHPYKDKSIIYEGISCSDVIEAIYNACNSVYSKNIKSALDNHANQLNPNNSEYWSVRQNK
jgi:DNA-directed RNA polymerase subunit L